MITKKYQDKYEIEYAIVNLSKLESALRIDAEYYDPLYLRNEKLIKKKDEKNIENLLIEKPQYGTTPRGGEFEDKGILFIRSQNFKNGFVDISQVVRCTDDFHKEHFISNVIKEDILIAVIGATIGEVGFYLEDEVANINQNIARVRLNKSLISPHYAFVFLLTRFNKLQLLKLSTGSAQGYLNSFQISSIKIPVPLKNFQNQINNLVLKSYKKRKKFKQLYKEAEDNLLEELGLKDWKPKTKKITINGIEFEEEKNISIRKLSEIFEVDRLDAEYFQPAYEELIKEISKKVEIKPLVQFITNFKKGIEVGSKNYKEKGKPFIRVSNLSNNGFVGKDQKYINEELYQHLKDAYEPKIEDFLLTKDAKPGIAYVVKEPIEGIICSGILKIGISESEINKEYLALCINSIVGIMQIERDGGGSVIIHWRPGQINKIQIPILSEETQQKIASLIQQAFESRRKSKDLLDIAKKSVEIYIEKDENNGLKYIDKELQKV